MQNLEQNALFETLPHLLPLHPALRAKGRQLDLGGEFLLKNLFGGDS